VKALGDERMLCSVRVTPAACGRIPLFYLTAHNIRSLRAGRAFTERHRSVGVDLTSFFLRCDLTCLGGRYILFKK
jgi:hypothetical protein